MISILFLSCNEIKQDEIKWKELEAKSHVQDSIELFNYIQIQKINDSINWAVDMLIKIEELHNLERQRDSIINTI